MKFRIATIDDVPTFVKMISDDALGIKLEKYTHPLPESYYDAFERIHEVWQLITNSGIGLLCLWLVWVKKETKISTLLSMLITGGFLLAFALKELYGGSMKYLDGSEKTLFGINIGIVGFGIAFILLIFSLLNQKFHSK